MSASSPPSSWRACSGAVHFSSAQSNCPLSARSSWRMFRRFSSDSFPFTTASKTGHSAVGCCGSLVLFCTSCVCASRDERFNDLQVPCEVHLDCPILHDRIATARPELIAKSRLGPETFHFSTALFERIEKTAAPALLDNLGEGADAASNHRRAVRERLGCDQPES